MRESISRRQQLRDSINNEIQARTRDHQQAVKRWRAARKAAAALAAPNAAPPAVQEPLVLLAHGDSWFDYPLDGNSLPLADTDIIAQLKRIGNPSPLILNVSHFGDATTTEMGLPMQERMIAALQDPNNWLGNGPDAILFSGGGDDIAGNQFCIFLDYNQPGSNGLNAARFQGVLDMVQASYEDLFDFRDRYASGVPIFGHCYDFAIPSDVHPACAGPWLKPSLDFCGWNTMQGTAIVRQALVNFKNMLVGLMGHPANPNDPSDPNNPNNFILVNTQNTLAVSDWANELHPYPEGFQKLALKFLAALQVCPAFAGRV